MILNLKMNESGDVSPPGSPNASGGSDKLTTKQYFFVNISKLITELVGTVGVGVFYFST